MYHNLWASRPLTHSFCQLRIMIVDDRARALDQLLDHEFTTQATVTNAEARLQAEAEPQTPLLARCSLYGVRQAVADHAPISADLVADLATLESLDGWPEGFDAAACVPPVHLNPMVWSSLRRYEPCDETDPCPEHFMRASGAAWLSSRAYSIACATAGQTLAISVCCSGRSGGLAAGNDGCAG